MGHVAGDFANLRTFFKRNTKLLYIVQSGRSSPCGGVYLRLINIGRPQGFQPAHGLYAVKEEQAAGVQLIEPLIGTGTCSAMAGLGGVQLSQSFEADAQSLTPQAQEALQWLCVQQE